jgi:predicted DCC family thiol-disulfide oxidoreductase YuxK
MFNCMKHETLNTLHTAIKVDVFSHLIIVLLLVIVHIKKHKHLVNWYPPFPLWLFSFTYALLAGLRFTLAEDKFFNTLRL